MSVWQRAAQHLSEAENIFLLGYSLPITDQFFHLLYALGTIGATRLKRLWVFDPDSQGQVKPRYEQMLGQSAEHRFNVRRAVFGDAIRIIREELHVQSHPDSLRFSKA